MEGFWGILLLGIMAFTVTILDEVFILLALFLDPNYSYKKVVIGQYIGVIIILLLSGLTYFFKFLIPEGWIGLLGLIPIYFGIRDLIKKHKNSEEETFVKINNYEVITVKEYEKIEIKKYNYEKFFKSNSKIFFVTFIFITNGLDSVGVFAPLFVSMTWVHMILLTAIFLIMTGITCVLPYFIVRNPIIGKVLRKFGNNLNPFILIFIGLVIFIENETFTVVTNYFQSLIN